MAVEQAIQWRAIQDAIYDWFNEATELGTLWSDQNTPQLPYPYATLNRISGPSRVGGKDDVITRVIGTAPNEQIEHCHQAPRHFTVSCQIHVGQKADLSGVDQEPGPECDAFALMSAAEARLGTLINRGRFRDVALAFVNVSAINSFDLPIGGEIISRVQMDVTFATMSRVTELDTFVEETTLSGTVTDPSGPDVSINFTVDSTP